MVAVSSAFFPRIAEHYAILTVGNSICRDCGPVLVSRDHREVGALRGKSVGVGGDPTTGSTLARMFVPDAQLVVHPYEGIIDAIRDDRLAAGVMIHEEIAAYRREDLHCVLDLGAAWQADTSLPLPVGLNVVRKSMGADLMKAVATGCERSMMWAMENRDAAHAFTKQFGRGLTEEHLAMFEAADSLRFGADVREGLRLMFDRIAELGLGPSVASFDVIQGDVVGNEEVVIAVIPIPKDS